MIQNSIRQLVASSPDRPAFYQQFLPLIAKETDAISGIAWDCSSRPFRPICQTRSNAYEELKIGITETEHAELLDKAINQSESQGSLHSLLVSQAKSPNGNANENPVIVISVVQLDGSVDLVELFYPNGLASEVYQQKVQEAGALCRTAAGVELGSSSDDPNFEPSDAAALSPLASAAAANSASRTIKIGPSELDEYVHQLHRSLDPKETAKQVANEVRRVLDCDRVSVVETQGRNCKVIAVSGQPSVNNRSNTLYLLRRLVRIVLPTRQSFWYPAENNLPGEIDKPLQAYLGATATRSMVVVPVFNEPPQYLETPDPVKTKPRLIGGLVIEHCGEEWHRSDIEDGVDIVSRHASDAIRNSYNHRQLLFYPIWKWLGKSKVVLAARNLPKTIAAAIGVLALGLLLAFFPADLKIACEGVLVPEQRSKVFVPLDGTISSIEVEHASKVKKGAPLVTLVNNELENQATELDGRIRELNTRIKNTETLLLSPNLDEQELGEQNLNAQKAQLESLQRQQGLVARKLENLKIISPIDGQVVTWNIEDRLKLRPVSRGDELMEVVNVDGKWQLELNAPDRSIGHIQRAFAKRGDDPLVVEFILAADTDKKFTGELIEIGKSTMMSQEDGPTVSLKIEIEDQDELDIRQIKSSVSANVICGKTSLGYSLFHGVTEFFQKHLFRVF